MAARHRYRFQSALLQGPVCTPFSAYHFVRLIPRGRFETVLTCPPSIIPKLSPKPRTPTISVAINLRYSACASRHERVITYVDHFSRSAEPDRAWRRMFSTARRHFSLTAPSQCCLRYVSLKPFANSFLRWAWSFGFRMVKTLWTGKLVSFSYLFMSGRRVSKCPRPNDPHVDTHTRCL